MQKQKEDALLERLKELMQHVGISPVTQEELIEAEAQLGFELPAFVRRLYCEGGNGGFGGMFPLISVIEIQARPLRCHPDAVEKDSPAVSLLVM